jgi:hypothetical protein
MRTLAGKSLAILLLAAAAPLAQAYTPNQAALVDSWYVRYLGRNGEPTGIADHAERLNQGMAPVAVEAGILASPEYFQRNGSSDPAVIQAIYREALGVNASPNQINQGAQGLAYAQDRQAYIAELLRVNRGGGAIAVPVQTYRPSYIVNPGPVYRPGYTSSFYRYGYRRPLFGGFYR